MDRLTSSTINLQDGKEDGKSADHHHPLVAHRASLGSIIGFGGGGGVSGGARDGAHSGNPQNSGGGGAFVIDSFLGCSVVCFLICLFECLLSCSCIRSCLHACLCVIENDDVDDDNEMMPPLYPALIYVPLLNQVEVIMAAAQHRHSRYLLPGFSPSELPLMACSGQPTSP